MNQDPARIPVPKEFCNSETNAPFTACLMCGQSLKEVQYVVEKAIKNYHSLGTSEIIFEYAMCLSCASKMHMELSAESRGRIENYMASHLSKKKSNDRDKGTFDLKRSISHCMINNTEVNKSSEYSMYALCNGDEIVLNELPYAISGEVQDEIMKLLSAKSLDLLDNFIGNHFSGPPEVMDILKRRPVLI